MKKFLEREKDKITIEYLVNVNRDLEDNLIVNLKNEIYELKKENEVLKRKLLKIFENIDIPYNEWKKWKEELSKLKESNNK